MTAELSLYVDSSWVSPWAFHAMVALEEKLLSYKLVTVPLPVPADVKATLQPRALLPKIPVLVHGDAWITESLAISEYLAERFPTPGHPRLFPADLVQRARARQVMSWLRTGLFQLRAERPTSNVFGRAETTPFTEKGRLEADELLRVAGALVAPGATQMFAEWSIADADLGLALMRLIASDDHVPEPLIAYAAAQWDRRSVKRYVAHVPTAH